MPSLHFTLAPLARADLAAIDRLDAQAFGPGRYARTAYRLREGADPDFSLSFIARVGPMLVGSNRMTGIACGDRKALLLGPLTVETAFHGRGIGAALIGRSLDTARKAGHGLVILVGDMAYYQRFGFVRVPPGRLVLPGPVDAARLLVCELEAEAFAGVAGVVGRG